MIINIDNDAQGVTVTSDHTGEQWIMSLNTALEIHAAIETALAKQKAKDELAVRVMKYRAKVEQEMQQYIKKLNEVEI